MTFVRPHINSDLRVPTHTWGNSTRGSLLPPTSESREVLCSCTDQVGNPVRRRRTEDVMVLKRVLFRVEGHPGCKTGSRTESSPPTGTGLRIGSLFRRSLKVRGLCRCRTLPPHRQGTVGLRVSQTLTESRWERRRAVRRGGCQRF